MQEWVVPAIVGALAVGLIGVRLWFGPRERLDDSPGATLARALEDSGQPPGEALERFRDHPDADPIEP